MLDTVTDRLDALLAHQVLHLTALPLEELVEELESSATLLKETKDDELELFEIGKDTGVDRQLYCAHKDVCSREPNKLLPIFPLECDSFILFELN